MWEQGVEAMLVTSVFAMPLVGFVLGAQGVGAEFERRTIPFLLTRPRHRFFYLWASWLVGAVEVVALVAISILLYASRSHMPSSPPASSANGALGAVAAMIVPAGVIYCLTFCFTVFLKKEQHGTTAAVAAIFSYSGIFVVIRLIYNIKLPIFWELYVGAFNPAKPLPLLSVSVWLGLALAFVAASHFHFQNAEA